MLGMHGTAFANYAAVDCDFLIAVGARFDDRVAGVPEQFASKARFIAQFDVDPAEIDKVKRVDWHHLGDMSRALDALARARARRSASIRTGRAAMPPGMRTSLHLKKAHAMNFDRDSALIQPLCRHRGDQSHHAWQCDRLHRRRPAPDVGRAVFRFHRAATLADLGFDGHDGLRAAGRDRRPVRAARPDRHRHRWRRQHPHESRRTRDRDHLQPAGQGRRPQQLRRRHGPAVAETVLQGAFLGHRQEPAQEGFHQGGRSRWLSRMRCDSIAPRTCRA